MWNQKEQSINVVYVTLQADAGWSGAVEEVGQEEQRAGVGVSDEVRSSQESLSVALHRSAAEACCESNGLDARPTTAAEAEGEDEQRKEQHDVDNKQISKGTDSKQEHEPLVAVMTGEAERRASSNSSNS